MSKIHLKIKIFFVTAIALYTWFYFCLPSKLFNAPTSFVIEDKDGNLLNASIAADGQWRFPYDEKVPDKWMAFDIGPKTQEHFSDIIKNSPTVFLAGPMGKFEDEKFAEGSKAILLAMKDLKENLSGETIIAGGDTIDVARKYTNLEDYTHVSLAGGATLEFLAGKTLPALVPLMEASLR